jgi:hypothetical protein
MHPSACDTADGILRWWFETEDGVSPKELKQALDGLVRQGLLEACPAADGRVRFRRRADEAALKAFLRR